MLSGIKRILSTKTSLNNTKVAKTHNVKRFFTSLFKNFSFTYPPLLIVFFHAI